MEALLFIVCKFSFADDIPDQGNLKRHVLPHCDVSLYASSGRTSFLRHRKTSSVSNSMLFELVLTAVQSPRCLCEPAMFSPLVLKVGEHRMRSSINKLNLFTHREFNNFLVLASSGPLLKLGMVTCSFERHNLGHGYDSQEDRFLDELQGWLHTGIICKALVFF